MLDLYLTHGQMNQSNLKNQSEYQEELVIYGDKLYYPHVNQLTIHHDNYRYRVVDAGRRFGKSAMSLNEGLAWILSKKNQMVWIVLPTYKQAHSIYWIDPDMTKYYIPLVQAGLLKKNDNLLSLFCPKTGSWLILKGADNPDSLRGSGLDLIIWDELRDTKPTALDIIRPTLADSPHHRQLFISSPNGFDHFHDLLLMGDHKGLIEKGGKDIKLDSDYNTYKFTSYDNLAWPEGSFERKTFVEYLNKERERYKSIGQEDWFEQEYMGEIRKRAGAVHKEFTRELHLIEPFDVPAEWRRIRGFDFGTEHPMASLRIAIDNDENWFIEYCYKQREKSIEEHAESIKAQDMDLGHAVSGFGDPSGPQWIVEFNKCGLSITKAKRKSGTEKKSWLSLGIELISAKIHPKKGHTVMLPDGRRFDNAPSFFILNRPENLALVDEIETLVYKKSNEGILKVEIDDTLDRAGHYDLHASLRYAAVSEGSAVSYGIVDVPRIDPRHPFVSPTTMTKDERKKAELEADLQIIRNDPRMDRW
jgi:hypothetical protein